MSSSDFVPRVRAIVISSSGHPDISRIQSPRAHRRAGTIVAPRWLSCHTALRTLTLIVTLMAAAAPRPCAAQETADALVVRGEALAYDLDHPAALALLRRAVAMAPDNPRTHRAVANVLWLNLLFKRGAVTVDHYLGSFTKGNVNMRNPPADLDAEFKREVAREQ